TGVVSVLGRLCNMPWLQGTGDADRSGTSSPSSTSGSTSPPESVSSTSTSETQSVSAVVEYPPVPIGRGDILRLLDEGRPHAAALAYRVRQYQDKDRREREEGEGGGDNTTESIKGANGERESEVVDPSDLALLGRILSAVDTPSSAVDAALGYPTLSQQAQALGVRLLTLGLDSLPSGCDLVPSLTQWLDNALAKPPSPDASPVKSEEKERERERERERVGRAMCVMGINGIPDTYLLPVLRSILKLRDSKDDDSKKLRDVKAALPPSTVATAAYLTLLKKSSPSTSAALKALGVAAARAGQRTRTPTPSTEEDTSKEPEASTPSPSPSTPPVPKSLWLRAVQLVYTRWSFKARIEAVCLESLDLTSFKPDHSDAFQSTLDSLSLSLPFEIPSTPSVPSMPNKGTPSQGHKRVSMGPSLQQTLTSTLADAKEAGGTAKEFMGALLIALERAKGSWVSFEQALLVLHTVHQHVSQMAETGTHRTRKGKAPSLPSVKLDPYVSDACKDWGRQQVTQWLHTYKAAKEAARNRGPAATDGTSTPSIVAGVPVPLSSSVWLDALVSAVADSVDCLFFSLPSALCAQRPRVLALSLSLAGSCLPSPSLQGARDQVLQAWLDQSTLNTLIETVTEGQTKGRQMVKPSCLDQVEYSAVSQHVSKVASAESHRHGTNLGLS
ncbi:hypothetical protein KIPB_000566, partial [Kipferlia bialata]